MNKKEYQKPTLKVVKLQHRSYLLAGSGLKSVSSTSNNLGTDGIGIDDTNDAGTGFWAK